MLIEENQKHKKKQFLFVKEYNPYYLIKTCPIDGQYVYV